MAMTGASADMPLGTLLIRADAGPAIGAGHLMRCLALAEAWRRRGGAVLMVTGALPEGLARRVAGAGAERLTIDGPDNDADGRWLAGLAEGRGAGWIVIDGYGFGPDYMVAAGESGRPVLMLDDDARHARYPVRAVLNQNLHARAEDYVGKTQATLMLGPGHALIRQDLRTWRHWKRHYPKTASKLLVTLGGADPGGHTRKVVEALGQLTHHAPEVHIVARVVVGGANPQAGALRALASENPDVALLFDVRDMAAQIRWCDAALSASGSTVWELALFQTPMLLATASGVEAPVAASLVAAGAARALGRLADLDRAACANALSALLGDAALRQSLGAAAAGLVDGDGADRVVEQMAVLSAPPG